MAENVTLARPYAEAAFELAKQSSLANWSSTLARMAAVAATEEMGECVGNPNLSSDQLTALFMEVVGGETSVDEQNFLRVLVDNKRVTVLPEISGLFEQLKNGHEGVKTASVESAFPMDDVQLQTLVADLEKKLACKITATVTVVPALLGGVRISIGDEVIDASVSGKLAAMKTALKN